jgi:hypothetical protein
MEPHILVKIVLFRHFLDSLGQLFVSDEEDFFMIFAT